jgi:anti-sigma regulatory factor (Ser/Thr protein kinase)
MPGERASAGDPIRRADNDAESTRVFPRQLRSVGGARDWLASFLDEQHVPVRMCDDAVLVISELATNALRHGLGDIVARVSLRDSGAVHLAVTDAGRELPELQPLDPARLGGVGLQIVDQLSERWGIAPFPGGKTVWATLTPKT